MEELQPQVGLGFGRLGNHQQSRGILVDAVHQPQPRVVHVVVGGVPEIVGQGIDQRAAVIAVAGVYHQSGRFVDHQHGVVFIDDIEGNILGNDFKFVAGRSMTTETTSSGFTR